MSKLDQFYTSRNAAKDCYRHCQIILRRTGMGNKLHFVEPSAGSGAFLKLMPKQNRTGFDIDPRDGEIIPANFLTLRKSRIPSPRERTVVIGNPPFGKRGRTAIEFFNKAANLASTIALILPVIFQKHAVQKQLDPRFSLVSAMQLPRTSFETPDGKPYEINTVFQVWTTKPNSMTNLRRMKPNPHNHPDFAMHQYNNTPEALKVFRRNFDFAVPSQGYQDYSRRETQAKHCEKNKQWILFQARSNPVLEALLEIDFHRLAMSCATITPGFRKNDVVEEYSHLHGTGIHQEGIFA